MNKLIANIEACKDFIKKTKRLNNPNKIEFINDEKTNLAVSMTLFSILNSIIEISEEIIDIEELRIPQSYQELFPILQQEKIISVNTSLKLKEYMKYRNMIAHQYAFFDIENIFEMAQNLQIFEKFIIEIENYLKSI